MIEKIRHGKNTKFFQSGEMEGFNGRDGVEGGGEKHRNFQ